MIKNIKQLQAISNGLPLEEVISRLEKHDNVDAVLVVGSGGNEALKPYSDYDLLVVLRKLPVGAFSSFAYIDNRIADVIYYASDVIRELAESNTLNLDDEHGALLSWLKHGLIKVDKEGDLRKLKEVAQNISSQIPFKSYYAAWYKINYNFAQNSRYFHAKEELYSEALDVRLLYSLMEVFDGYFTLRGLPWQGEKDAIRYLKKNDQDFLERFQCCLAESDRDKKFTSYAQLVERTLGDAGKWRKEIVAAMPTHEVTPDNAEKLANLWNELLSES